MEKSKIIKTIGALCLGAGIGVCFGVATQNLLSGILIGLGIGLCFSVAFNSSKK